MAPVAKSQGKKGKAKHNKPKNNKSQRVKRDADFHEKLKALNRDNEDLGDEDYGDDSADDSDENTQFLSELLDEKPKEKRTKQAPAPVMKEAYDEGAFNISTGDSKVGPVTVDRLMDALKQDTSANMKRIQKKLTKLTGENAASVGLEKPKHMREKDERIAVKKEVVQGLQDWMPGIKELEKKATINYPLHIASATKVVDKSLSHMVANQDEPDEDSLEAQVRNALSKAGIDTEVTHDSDGEEDMIALDSRGNNLLEGANDPARKSRMAKLRAMVQYKVEKLTRLKKIKSKTYRKILRKAKANKEEKALERLEQIDPQAAIRKRRQKMEMDRAKERATLKHRNNAATSRRKREVMKWNKGAREDMQAAHRMADKLTSKWTEAMDHQMEEDSEESDDEDEGHADELTAPPTASEAKSQKSATSIIQALRMEVKNEKPEAHPLLNLPFMKRSYAKQKDEILAEIDRLEQDVSAAQDGKADVKKLQEELTEANAEDREQYESDYDEFGELRPKAEARKQASKKRFEEQKAKKQEKEEAKAKRKREEEVLTMEEPVVKRLKGGKRVLVLPSTGQLVEDAKKEEIEAAERRAKEKKELEKAKKEETKAEAKKKKEEAKKKKAEEAEKGEEEEDEPAPEAVEMSEDEDEDEEMDEDEEDEFDDEEEDMALRETTSQDALVSRAFAGDEVDEEFMKEKEEMIAKDATPMDPNAALPGWGEWGGADPKLGVRHKARVKELEDKRKEEIDALKAKRKDADMGNVIINENVDTVPAEYKIHRKPAWIESDEDFQATLRHPLNPQLNTSLINKETLAPKIRTKQGVRIDPLTKDALPAKEAEKTTRQKTDATRHKKKPSKK